jgi:hypothetical protein
VSRTCVIPLGRRGEHHATVDADDYAFLTQWRWNYKRSRGGNVYARRTQWDGASCVTVLMHDVVLLERKGEPRPTPKHTADHDNRDSLDNTRVNLKWACKSAQGRNRRKPKRRNMLTACNDADSLADIPF